jgi:hypothetical protein
MSIRKKLSRSFAFLEINSMFSNASEKEILSPIWDGFTDMVQFNFSSLIR